MECLLTSYTRRINGPFLRFSLAIILAWIGALKFVDPSPVVGLRQAFAGLITVGLFLGTLTIFVVAPSVTNFPTLSLAGQFLLKDLGLTAAAVNIIALAAAREARSLAAHAVTA